MDGAGDLRGCSSALTKANVRGGLPVELSVFSWSHGFPRLLMDHADMAHARSQGKKLAQKIAERRAVEPGRRVVLVAHSAGCAVALAAADAMPPDAIDRLILLAPSVSTGYDIRPALRAAREGVSPSEVVNVILRTALAAEIGEAAGQPPMADVIQDVVNANQRAGKG